MENKPKSRGTFIFEGIMEGGEGDKRSIKFNPPLKVAYTIWDKIDKDTGLQNFEADVPMMGIATYDFGLTMETPLDPEHNWLTNGYNGLTKDSSPEDILMGSIMFDLFHAFFHETQDPNYSHYHWALVGWLKNRAALKDDGA
jgi:hypothetical protein